jgi:hypothetical protein
VWIRDRRAAGFWTGTWYFARTLRTRDSKTEARLETVWDWVTVFGFAGLVTLLLQRSSEAEPRDELWQYGPPAVGFAVANYFGNEGQPWIAGALLIAVVVYIFKVLKVTLPGR